MHQEAEPTSAPHLSIVIPVFNESRRIAETLSELSAFLDTLDFSSEVLIIDDGSTDTTPALVDAHIISHPTMRLLSLPHGGKARAVLAGLREATGAMVGFMDADLATPLSTLRPALAQLHNGTDVVIASREGDGSDRVGEPWYRHLMGRVFNGIVRLALLPTIQDSQCGFKFMTRESRDQILPRVQLYQADETVTAPRVTAFDVELLYIARLRGLTIHAIPVTWQYGSHSKVNPVADTLQNLKDVMTVWVNGKRGLYR